MQRPDSLPMSSLRRTGWRSAGPTLTRDWSGARRCSAGHFLGEAETLMLLSSRGGCLVSRHRHGCGRPVHVWDIFGAGHSNMFDVYCVHSTRLCRSATANGTPGRHGARGRAFSIPSSAPSARNAEGIPFLFFSHRPGHQGDQATPTGRGRIQTPAEHPLPEAQKRGHRMHQLCDPCSIDILLHVLRLLLGSGRNVSPLGFRLCKQTRIFPSFFSIKPSTPQRKKRPKPRKRGSEGKRHLGVDLPLDPSDASPLFFSISICLILLAPGSERPFPGGGGGPGGRKPGWLA